MRSLIHARNLGAAKALTEYAYQPPPGLPLPVSLVRWGLTVSHFAVASCFAALTRRSRWYGGPEEAKPGCASLAKMCLANFCSFMPSDWFAKSLFQMLKLSDSAGGEQAWLYAGHALRGSLRVQSAAGRGSPLLCHAAFFQKTKGSFAKYFSRQCAWWSLSLRRATSGWSPTSAST